MELRRSLITLIKYLSRMDIVNIIRKKKDGVELSEEEIFYFVLESAKHPSGKVHEAQIGAMLMAISLKGLSDTETFHLTKAMIESGTVLKWPYVTVDKHSTGGVGDKVSIALTPALAATGFHVPMISGRGLSFTGGTLDKLESIPGFQVALPEKQMFECLEKCGCFIAATTSQLCPADKVLYAIRDTTATIDSTPLIIGSIFSKKVVSGANFFVLDLKVGPATFFKMIEPAKELASKLISISKQFNIKTRIVLTRMEEPLGYYIGNALEIIECVDIMKGNGPTDLQHLICHLGGELLNITGSAKSTAVGKQMIEEVLSNGKALKKFTEMLICQGVEKEVAQDLCSNDPWTVLKKSSFQTPFTAEVSGWIASIDALAIGEVCRDIGGGRKIPGEKIDYSVGAVLRRKSGSTIEKGEVWITIHHNKNLTQEIMDKLKLAIIITEKPVIEKDLILEVISS